MRYVARFGILYVMRHQLAFTRPFEHVRMHANAFFYLHVASIRLHELAWHSNGSVKCQMFEYHSND